MKHRVLIGMILLGLALAGCGGHPDISLTITGPANGATILLAANTQPDPVSHPEIHWLPGTIDLVVGNLPREVSSPCDYPATAWEIRDNGQLISAYVALCSDATPNYSFRWEPSTLGQHVLRVRAGVQLDLNSNSDRLTWYEAPSVTVCVVNDPLAPVSGVPVANVGNCTIPPVLVPTFTPTTTPTRTPTPTTFWWPTVTPVPEVPVQENPNQHGEGCAQYTDVTSCNLAACSWTGTVCVITP
jgi:hypothetical protein